MHTPDADALPRFLTIRQVVEMLNVSEASVYRWSASGQFPRQYSFGDNCSRWSRSEIDAWLIERMAVRDVG